MQLNEPSSIFTLANITCVAAVVFSVFFIYEGIKLSVEARRWALYGVTNHVRFLRLTTATSFSKVYGHFWVVPTLALMVITFYPLPSFFQGLVILSGIFALGARFIWTGYFFSEKPGKAFKGKKKMKLPNKMFWFRIGGLCTSTESKHVPHHPTQ